MKIVLIDHNDSFTYNIVEQLRKISGQTPVVIASGEVEISTLQKFDKIILSPGPGLPRDFVNIKRILNRYKNTKPILGICLGHQAIAHYFGAKLANLPQVVHGQPKKIIQVNKSIIFKGLPDQITVGLYHSWVVDENDFPKVLQITATDKSGRIMALQHHKLPIFGVQFHPESHMTLKGEKMLFNFINL